MFPFRKTVRKADRVRRYTIQSIDGGWEVITEQDEHSIRRVAYDDWHRVERARRMIALELNTLRAHGWTDVTESNYSAKR
jgi:hypothetical protein